MPLANDIQSEKAARVNIKSSTEDLINHRGRQEGQCVSRDRPVQRVLEEACGFFNSWHGEEKARI